MSEPCNLYRVLYDTGLGGYLVYRHCFDEQRCSIKTGARAHQTAMFITENEADDYAAYRNRLVDQNGTDALMPVYGSRPTDDGEVG